MIYLKKLVITGVLLVPFVLIALPVDFFDNGISICPSKVFLDTECLGCGITRAIMHLIHFDFRGAAGYNKLSFIVLPILFLLWLKLLFKEFKIIK